MPGLTAQTPIPTEIRVQQSARSVMIEFDDGLRGELSFEFLRVYSPSAEVRGHGVGQEILQTGKREVMLLDVQPVGHYAVKLVFSDGHDSGLYSWDHLHLLCANHDALWADYLARLEEAGASREATATDTSSSTSSSCRSCKG